MAGLLQRRLLMAARGGDDVSIRSEVGVIVSVLEVEFYMAECQVSFFCSDLRGCGGNKYSMTMSIVRCFVVGDTKGHHGESRTTIFVHFSLFSHL